MSEDNRWNYTSMQRGSYSKCKVAKAKYIVLRLHWQICYRISACHHNFAFQSCFHLATVPY